MTPGAMPERLRAWLDAVEAAAGPLSGAAAGLSGGAPGLWYLLNGLVFLGILMAVEGLRQLLHRGENRAEAVNRRMRMRAQGRSGEEVLQLLKPPARRGPLQRLPIVGDLPAALRMAGLRMRPGVFLALCGAGFLAGVALASGRLPLHLALPLSAAAFLVAPLSVLRSLRARRQARLVGQLPDALDLMSRGLRVGHPVGATLRSVADEMPDPIGTEFGLVVDQVAYGDELPEAMREMADRVGQEDMRYLATAIAMQHGTGGDLARVLATLSRVIRTRQMMRRKVGAISAEGRLTAYVLSALPVLIAVFMSVTTPSYYGDVMDAPGFWPVMGAIAAAVVANAVILFRLVSFRF